MDDEEKADAIALGRQHAVLGFAALADFIAGDPDSETYVFRKFDKLTARTLLAQQAELVYIESELDKAERVIVQSPDLDVKLAARSWSHMQRRIPEHPEVEAFAKISAEAKEKLQQYHESLLRQSQIAELELPSKRVLSALRTELHGSTELPGDGSILATLDRTILDDKADLVALKPPAFSDPLSSVVRRYWPVKFQKSVRQTYHTWQFEERMIVRAASTISTAVAGLLLIGSILALYWTVNADARLGLVLGFIVLFALGVSTCTNASRDAVFAATAAYSAVLVVFVSGNLGNANNTAFAANALTGTAR